MKKYSILLLNLMLATYAFGQQTFTVTASDFVFSPDVINAQVGDNIVFNTGTRHPVLQVTEAAFQVNGNTAVSGGFSFPSGSGTFTPQEAGTYYYICINHFSMGMKGKIVITQSVGIQYVTNDMEIELYPNPVVDYLYVKGPSEMRQGRIEIFDLAGKSVLSFSNSDPLNENRSLDLRNLNKGMYMAKITSTDKTLIKKFIKQ
jgi:plastocyanin